MIGEKATCPIQSFLHLCSAWATAAILNLSIASYSLWRTPGRGYFRFASKTFALVWRSCRTINDLYWFTKLWTILGSLVVSRLAIGQIKDGMLCLNAWEKEMSIHKQRWSVFGNTLSKPKYPPSEIWRPRVIQMPSIGSLVVLRWKVAGPLVPCLSSMSLKEMTILAWPSSHCSSYSHCHQLAVLFDPQCEHTCSGALVGTLQGN